MNAVRISDSAFAAAWKRASVQKGWFSKGEARLMFRFACEVPPGEVIVEIGSYCGRCTVILACSGREVIAVDPLVPGTAPTGTWQVTEEHAEDMARIADEYDNVTWLRVASTDCPAPARLVGLLMIDGDHDWPHPFEDYERFELSLAEGAVVAFHDYRVCGGVTRAVDELVSAGRIAKLVKRERLFVAKRTATARATADERRYGSGKRRTDYVAAVAVGDMIRPKAGSCPRKRGTMFRLVERGTLLLPDGRQEPCSGSPTSPRVRSQ